jgi:SAM-dependent methyltransferase
MNLPGFLLLWLCFAVRDLLRPPQRKLEKTGLGPGASVLDYGCGPGSAALAAARMVGASGRVFAADISRTALRFVARSARLRGLRNVETLHTDCATGLPDNSLDLILLHDVFHDLKQPGPVLAELHRVLRPGGLFCFSDHHLDLAAAVRDIEATALFRLERPDPALSLFRKAV